MALGQAWPLAMIYLKLSGRQQLGIKALLYMPEMLGNNVLNKNIRK